MIIIFGIYNKKIKEILTLALLKEAEYNKEVKSGIHSVGISDFLKYWKELEDYESTKIDKDLTNTLNELDEQIVLCVQALMYLGCVYESNEGITPLKAYKLIYQDLKNNGDEKDIRIEMMIGKVPFGSYLENGLRLLNVNL